MFSGCRPGQFTNDIIPELDHILSTHTSQYEQVVSLAVQSLHLLVESEVLDVKSTWDVISQKIDIQQETR